MSVFPKYVVTDPSEPNDVVSSIPVIRASDSAQFLGSKFPNVVTKDIKQTTWTTSLAQAVLPTAAVPLSRILNHPNIVSLVDIVNTSELEDAGSQAGEHANMTIWEDMDAGCLSYLLPPAEKLPDFADKEAWSVLCAVNYQRFSLPESLCWHVLRSITRSLLWLHYGVKETAGVPGEWKKHDDDWQPILIMDVSPGQIWFQKPKGKESYGACKLGGFRWARVTGVPGGSVALAGREEKMPKVKKYYWAPEVYKNVQSPSRPSEIWSLGAVIYTMMTGIPPARYYEYAWNVSRMTDKGFTQGLRNIVGKMLEPHPADRPTAMELVHHIEDEWIRWRTTAEGADYEDVNDWRLIDNYLSSGKRKN